MKKAAENHLKHLLYRYPKLAELREGIAYAAASIVKTHCAGGKVLVCGNGGSAADSEHIVGELMKGFLLNRELPCEHIEKLRRVGAEQLGDSLQQGIRAISLTVHASLSTAVLNDNDPLMAFAQQVYVYGAPEDVLIALSTSGNSINVVNALKVAKAFGVFTIGLTGQKPALMDDLCDIILKAPAEETYQVQEMHLPIYHAICAMAEEEVFGV